MQAVPLAFLGGLLCLAVADKLRVRALWSTRRHFSGATFLRGRPCLPVSCYCVCCCTHLCTGVLEAVASRTRTHPCTHLSGFSSHASVRSPAFAVVLWVHLLFRLLWCPMGCTAFGALLWEFLSPPGGEVKGALV
jgi:hypothetical protein